MTHTVAVMADDFAMDIFVAFAKTAGSAIRNMAAARSRLLDLPPELDAQLDGLVMSARNFSDGLAQHLDRKNIDKWVAKGAP